MSKFASTAALAAGCIQKGQDPKIAWEDASSRIFCKGSSLQKKTCPKNAFLGLYGININGKNAQYAIKALGFLRENNSLNKKELWKMVAGENKTHNQQMNVVLALFNGGFIK